MTQSATRDIDRPDFAAAPFFLLHVLAIVGVVMVGFSWEGVLLAVALYYLRMFGITAGYHRYFSHRGYKTSRVFQFFMAFLGTLAMQKGVLWWAAHHRDHHKYSDTELDIHSPRRGFWWSHAGWIISHRFDDTKFDRIKDFAKYPELMFLNRHCFTIPIVTSLSIWAVFGFETFIWCIVSTVVLWHGTFSINSFAHIFGKVRYDAGDDSKNSLILALITMGEGWHNNHHYYQSTANQGFFWWEIDMSYYVLKVLSWFGIVWDLRTPPKHILEGEKAPKAANAPQPEPATAVAASWAPPPADSPALPSARV